MSAKDDALAVARFCFPEHEWGAGRKAGDAITCVRLAETYWCSYVHEHIAAAERVVVERGISSRWATPRW